MQTQLVFYTVVSSRLSAEEVPNGIPNGIVQIGEASDEGNNGESCCRKCCGAVYPSGFRKELLPLLRTTWPIVSNLLSHLVVNLFVNTRVILIQNGEGRVFCLAGCVVLVEIGFIEAQLGGV